MNTNEISLHLSTAFNTLAHTEQGYISVHIPHFLVAVQTSKILILECLSLMTYTLY